MGKTNGADNRTKTKVFTDPQEIHRFLSTPGIELANLMFASETVVWASWGFIVEERVPSIKHMNEIIGDYVTAEKRIHLYSYRDRLLQRARYCDTESVVYIQPKNEPALLKRGEFLGI